MRLCINEYPTCVCGPDPAYVITQVPYTCQKFAYTRTAQPLLWPKSNLNSMYSSIYSTLCRALYNPATWHHPALFMCMLPPVNICCGPFKNHRVCVCLALLQNQTSSNDSIMS